MIRVLIIKGVYMILPFLVKLPCVSKMYDKSKVISLFTVNDLNKYVI